MCRHLYIAEKARKEKYARPAKINDLITPTIASHGRPAKVPGLSASDVNIKGDGYRDRGYGWGWGWRGILTSVNMKYGVNKSITGRRVLCHTVVGGAVGFSFYDGGR